MICKSWDGAGGDVVISIEATCCFFLSWAMCCGRATDCKPEHELHMM